jgi:hypothetical protein
MSSRYAELSALLRSQEKVVMPIFPSVLPLCELTDQIATVWR